MKTLVVAAFTSVSIIMVFKVTDTLDDMLRYQGESDKIFYYYLCLIPGILKFQLPLLFLFSVSFIFTNLKTHFEHIPVWSSGYSYTRVFNLSLLVCILLTFTFFFSIMR